MSFTVALTGDSLITRPFPALDDAGFVQLREIIRDADAAFTNLEVICGEPPLMPRPRWLWPQVHAPMSVLDDIRDYGFNLFSLANNHTLDYMYDALVQTLRGLEQRAMTCAGAGRTLGEARRPRYLDVAGQRIALLAACSTDADVTIAADPDGVAEGRPGISALRFGTAYEVEPRFYVVLKEMDEALGTAEGTRLAEAIRGVTVGAERRRRGEQVMSFLGTEFFEGPTTEVRTWPLALDVDDISRWIRDARRQADLVIMSLHCHEGARGVDNSASIAEFAVEAARRFIDAGADIFVGHGPHVLSSIEIYRDRPIFHSLGNFVFMPETVATLPAEFLRAVGLSHSATQADFQAHLDETAEGFIAFREYNESVVPVCTIEDGGSIGVDLRPITLDAGPIPHRRGIPRLASDVEGDTILARLTELSKPYGTRIVVERDATGLFGRIGV